MLRIKALIFSAFLMGAGPIFGQATDIITWTNPWKYSQEGALPAEDWMLPGYDDSTWPGGNGVLGFPHNENLVIGGVGVNTILSQTSAAGSNIITYYFRTTFVVGSTNAVTLMASNLLDDAAVIYINGREVARPGMATGSVSYATLAERSGEITVWRADFYSVPLDFVTVGTNVIAVEVHQNSTNSSDMIMGMRLVAESQAPSDPPTITAHPQDITADAGKTAQFTVAATGQTPLTYRWYTNGILVSSLNSATYTTPITTLAMDGTMVYVTVSNHLGTVTSRQAVLTVVPDVNGPRMLSAMQVLSNGFEIRFNENITQASGQNVSNYVVHLLGTTNTLVVTQVQWGINLARVRVNTTFDPNTSYIVCIYNIADQQGNITSGDCMGITRPPLMNQVVLLGDEWRLSHDPPVNGNWKLASFEDSGWITGTGLFWNGTNAPATCSTPGTQIQKSRSQYYRKRFTIPSTSATNVTLSIQYVADDGAVLYVNGFEVTRYNMGPGSVDHETIPSATVSGPPVCVTLMTNVPGSLLSSGTNNVLAVEVHQAETDPERLESDLAFDASLSLSYSETPTIPALRITHPNPTTVRVGWIGNGWRLERSAALEGAPWEVASPISTVQGTNAFNDTVSGKRFYRLKNP
jgi:hypothetical protein